MNNGIAFGPDGKLYLAQGSLSGYGAPDQAWGFRAETTALGLDPRRRRPRRRPLRRLLVGQRQHLHRLRPGARRRRGARSTRWAPATRSTSCGTATARCTCPSTSRPPATRRPAPAATRRALSNLPAGRDFLARVQQGKYYGHPNPTQNHYVLNGGNPTAAVDPFETPQYPVGVQPDAEYQQPDPGPRPAPLGRRHRRVHARTSSARPCGTSC